MSIRSSDRSVDIVLEFRWSIVDVGQFRGFRKVEDLACTLPFVVMLLNVNTYFFIRIVIYKQVS